MKDIKIGVIMGGLFGILLGLILGIWAGEIHTQADISKILHMSIEEENGFYRIGGGEAWRKP